MGLNGTGAAARAAALAIDQSIARDLLIDYQNRRGGGGSYGSSKIRNDIYEVIGTDSNITISRDDISKWLSGRTKRLGDGKFQAVIAFIYSAKFQTVVGEATQHFNDLKRTIEIGCALSQLEGYRRGQRKLSHLDGLWLISCATFDPTRIEPGEELTRLLRDPNRTFMRMASVPGYGFSVVHFMKGWALSSLLPYDLCASGFMFHEEHGGLIVRVKDRNRSCFESRYRIDLFEDPILTEVRSSANKPDERSSGFTLDTLLGLPDERHFLSCMSSTLLHTYRCSSLLDRATRYGLMKSDDEIYLNQIKNKFDQFLWNVVSQNELKY